MKKSELRNIIKESIKQLMTEQNNPNARRVTTLFCDGSHANLTQTDECSTLYPNVPHFANAPVGTQCTGVMNANYFHNMTINGGTPQLGDVFNFNAQLNGITGFPGGIGMINSNSAFFNGWFGDHVVVQVFSASTNTSQVDYSSAAACPPFSITTSGCPPCDPSAWPNMQNWVANWTNGGPFNSSNQLQPCTHICNKIQQWTTACANAGPVQANQLSCKIDEANDQATTHGCNC
jgi:hypothetical protein